MSHYPSSAELAAFRWPWPRTVPNDPMVNRPTLWELRYGTVQEAGQRDFAGDPARHSVMRAEASALRSRAFGRIFGDDVTWPEITTFAPIVACPCGHSRDSIRHKPPEACSGYRPGPCAQRSFHHEYGSYIA